MASGTCAARARADPENENWQAGRLLARTIRRGSDRQVMHAADWPATAASRARHRPASDSTVEAGTGDRPEQSKRATRSQKRRAEGCDSPSGWSEPRRARQMIQRKSCWHDSIKHRTHPALALLPSAASPVIHRKRQIIHPRHRACRGGQTSESGGGRAIWLCATLGPFAGENELAPALKCCNAAGL